MYPFPSINQFRNVVQHVRRQAAFLGLDEQGEAALLLTVEELKKTQTTVLIITHRPSILKATNKILVMNSGRVEKYANSSEILNAITPQKNLQMTQPKINLTKPGS